MGLLLVDVRSSSRLHFGLLSFGGSGRQYGGVGAMVAEPALRLTLEPAPTCEVAGVPADVIHRIVHAWARQYGVSDPPVCRIRVLSQPPRHAGLGSGTQLACGVAAGLNALAGFPPLSATELAQLTGRAQRSAIGTHGFLLGGLIFERGRLAADPVAPLQQRLPIPQDWRFVLLRPLQARGLAGLAERRAFSRLPPVPTAVRDRLADEVERAMLPRLLANDCDGFGESVYHYNRLAGSCYAPVQGGLYHGPEVEQLVADVRALGVRGVGQSSWGPTVFCVLPHAAAADRLTGEMRDRYPAAALQIVVTPPDNHGAVITPHKVAQQSMGVPSRQVQRIGTDIVDDKTARRAGPDL